jgi:hypothetical protein
MGACRYLGAYVLVVSVSKESYFEKLSDQEACFAAAHQPEPKRRGSSLGLLTS